MRAMVLWLFAMLLILLLGCTLPETADPLMQHGQSFSPLPAPKRVAHLLTHSSELDVSDEAYSLLTTINLDNWQVVEAIKLPLLSNFRGEFPRDHYGRFWGTDGEQIILANSDGQEVGHLRPCSTAPYAPILTMHYAFLLCIEQNFVAMAIVDVNTLAVIQQTSLVTSESRELTGRQFLTAIGASDPTGNFVAVALMAYHPYPGIPTITLFDFNAQEPTLWSKWGPFTGVDPAQVLVGSGREFYILNAMSGTKPFILEWPARQDRIVITPSILVGSDVSIEQMALANPRFGLFDDHYDFYAYHSQEEPPRHAISRLEANRHTSTYKPLPIPDNAWVRSLALIDEQLLLLIQIPPQSSTEQKEVALYLFNFRHATLQKVMALDYGGELFVIECQADTCD